jgi:hypothetical protein
MIRDYQIVSPSLDGILQHESLSYEGFSRPPEVARIFDRPAGPHEEDIKNPAKQRIIEQYFHDLYNLLVKKISQFAMEPEPAADEGVKLMAMLQEFVKIKGLLAGEGKV